MKHAMTLALLAALPLAGIAADSPYAGQESRKIKALTDQEISDYLNGRGMGSSKAAELNHYPGPRHVLDHAQQLGLSQQQVEKTQAIHDAMAKESAALGRQIVDREAELEALYATHQADAGNTQRIVLDIASLQAQYRLAHLNAHLSMKSLLSPQQIAAYDRVRGYVNSNADARPSHHRHH